MTTELTYIKLMGGPFDGMWIAFDEQPPAKLLYEHEVQSQMRTLIYVEGCSGKYHFQGWKS